MNCDRQSRAPECLVPHLPGRVGTRRRWFAALALLLGVALALGVGEVLLRAVVNFQLLGSEDGFTRLMRQGPRETVDTVSGGRQIFRPSEHPDIGWEPIPRVEVGHIRINAGGFRGREYPPSPPPGVERIVVLGDSETFGFNLREEETFPSILESRLNARGGRRFEALNFAAPGYNTANQLAVLRKRAIRYRPGIVVLMYNFNDPEIGDPYLVLGRGLPSRSYLYLLAAYLHKRATALPDLRARARTAVEYYHLLHASPYGEASRRLVLEMADFAQQHGACCVLVIDPHIADREPLGDKYPYRDIHARLAALASESITVVDPLAALAAANPDPTVWWIGPYDRHKNAAAHAVIADCVAEVILRGAETIPVSAPTGPQ